MQTAEDTDLERVMLCLKRTGLDSEIMKYPQGINSIMTKSIENGIVLSGGQQQKLLMSRALYKDSPILILDEPTAALDPIAEFEIYSKFNEIVGSKTAIYISHRLSSCRFCDDIAVFHEGELIQRGSHDELVSNTNGKYYELWNAQAQYYA